jgi:predicted dehydrogenase
VVEVTVHGTQAVARNTGDGARLTLQPRGSTEQEEIPLEPLDTIADQLAEFVAAVRGERSPETDGVEGRRAVSVLEAIVEAANTRRWVEVVYP